MFDFVFRQLRSRKVCDPIFFSFRSFVFVIANFQKKSSKNSSLRERDRISRNTKTQPPIPPLKRKIGTAPTPHGGTLVYCIPKIPLPQIRNARKKPLLLLLLLLLLPYLQLSLLTLHMKNHSFPPSDSKRIRGRGRGEKWPSKKKRRRKELLRKKSIKAKESKNLAKFVCARIIESAPPSPKRNVL